MLSLAIRVLSLPCPVSCRWPPVYCPYLRTVLDHMYCIHNALHFSLTLPLLLPLHSHPSFLSRLPSLGYIPRYSLLGRDNLTHSILTIPIISYILASLSRPVPSRPLAFPSEHSISSHHLRHNIRHSISVFVHIPSSSHACPLQSVHAHSIPFTPWHRQTHSNAYHLSLSLSFPPHPSPPSYLLSFSSFDPIHAIMHTNLSC